jgi:hypothetical protein
MQCTGDHGNNKNFYDGSSSQGPVFHSGQLQRMQVASQGFQTPQRQIQRTNFQSPRSAPPPPQRNNNTHSPSFVGPCYTCGQSRHYANRCLRKKAK